MLEAKTSGYLPLVSYNVFFFSLVVSTFIMLVFSMPVFHELTFGSQGTFLDTITYIVDPLLLHVLGIACTAILIWYRVSLKNRWKKFLLSICLPSLLLLFVYGLTELVFKPSFAILRPAEHLTAPWLTALIGMGKKGMADSCPSGFVVRQSFLFFLGLSFYRRYQPSVKSEAKLIEYVAFLFLIFSTIFIVFSRVYRGFHSVFDVAVAICVSCYTFWLLFYILGSFVNRLPRNATSGIVAVTFVLLPIFLYYSQDAHWLALIGIGLFWIIGLTYIIAGYFNKEEGNETK